MAGGCTGAVADIAEGAPMAARIDEEITFRKLEILLAFMETGNLARAADLLGISTASVHRALHSLETGTRCALFRMEGRNLLPNDAAHALADTAREVLRAMSEGIRSTRELAGYAADRIRIGSLYSLTSRVVPALVMGLKLRRSEIQTELVLGSNVDLLRKLHEGVIDAALMGLPDGAPDIESQLLFEDDIFFAAPEGSRYAQQAQVDLSACADERFVSLSEGFVTYGGFMEAFRIAGFTPKVVMTTGDIFSLMNLVSGGVGCTLLPGRVRSTLPKKVQLIPLQARYSMRQKISACFLRTRERDPNLLALLATCRGYREEAD
jgi:LysR family transcriptional regulator, malonate utilization transcriptional regulator